MIRHRSILAAAGTGLVLLVAAALAHQPEGVVYRAFHFADAAVPVMDGDLADWDQVPEEYLFDLTHHEEIAVKLFDQYEMGLPAIAGHTSLLSPDAAGHAENWRRLTGAVDLCVDWAGAAGPAALDTILGSGPDSWDHIDFVLERLGTLVDYCAAREVVLALEPRRQTGKGQYLDMAMYECMVAHIESNMNFFQATGSNPARSIDRFATAGITFEAKDGYVVLAGLRTEARMRDLWTLIGREDLLEGDTRYLAGPGMDGQFYYEHIIPTIEVWSSQLGKFEVAAKLTEIGFSMGVTQTMADLDVCPQLNARQMFIETGDTLGGKFRGVKTPARLTACIDSPTKTPPQLGEHNEEILCSLGGMTSEEVAVLTAEGVL